MTTLILIRHGESEANRQGIFAGQIDPELQNKGLKQAELTAKYIAGNYEVDKIYSSDLQRAYKTALCLAEKLNLEVTKDKNLREIDAGKWEGVSFDSIIKNYPQEYSAWVKDIGNSRCPDGESVKEVGERVLSALTRIAGDNEGKTVVIATHATPVRVAQCIIGESSLDEMKNIPWVSNASVTEVSYDNGKWELVKVGEDSHLAELKTVLPSNI